MVSSMLETLRLAALGALVTCKVLHGSQLAPLPGDGGLSLMPFAPGPSNSELEFLQSALRAAEGNKNAEVQKTRQMRAACMNASSGLEAANMQEAAARKRLADATAARIADDQRIAALPQLVRAAQMAAYDEQKKRIAAEQRAANARQQRIIAESAHTSKISHLQAGMQTQRFADRLRAAEDARIAAAAVRAAQQAKTEVEARAHAAELIRRADLEAQKLRSESLRAQMALLTNMSAAWTSQVATAAASTERQHALTLEALRDVNDLRLKAEKSEAMAKTARMRALTDRVRAAVSNEASKTLDKVESKLLSKYEKVHEKAKESEKSALSDTQKALAAKQIQEAAAANGMQAIDLTIRTVQQSALRAQAAVSNADKGVEFAHAAPKPYVTGFEMGWGKTTAI